MSHFSAALRAFRQGRDLTQQGFAALTGLAQNEVSYYERDEHLPGVENLRRMLLAAGPDDRLLLLAYLKDNTPEEFHDRIRVVSRT